MTDRTTTDTTYHGPVAQMVEQSPCKRQVAGSIPGQGLHIIHSATCSKGYINHCDCGAEAEYLYGLRD